MNRLYEELALGETASFEKTITEGDVYLFAGVTGDTNPAHINQKYAQGTKFKARIAHGMLSGSLISTVLGTILPGPGTIYLSQSLNFLAPVFFGDTIKATVTVAEKLPKGRVRLSCRCENQDGVAVVEGEAMVLAPREKLQ